MREGEVSDLSTDDEQRGTVWAHEKMPQVLTSATNAHLARVEKNE